MVCLTKSANKVIAFYIALHISIAICNEQIILNENNTVILDSKVNDESVSNIMYQLALRDNIGAEPIYLYIHSHGGEVTAGNTLIDFIHFYNKRNNLICVANYAASMAFAILQSCKTRYGTSKATLMQHQIHVHINNVKKNIDTYMIYATDLQKEFIVAQAKRIGMTEEKFYNKIKDDWWLTGVQGINEGVLDKLVTVGCDINYMKELYNVTEYNDKYIETLIYSRCPLIVNPIQRIISPPI